MPSARTELRFSEDLADGLRSARLAAGIGLRPAARLLGVDISTIYRIESGEISPRMTTLTPILKLYGANLNIGPDGLMLTWMAKPEEED